MFVHLSSPAVTIGAFLAAESFSIKDMSRKVVPRWFNDSFGSLCDRGTMTEFAAGFAA